jgi:HD superfamily phosphohydrolase
MIINDNVYGEQNVEDTLIIELINSPIVQRLKFIGQYGTWEMMDKRFSTTRFEHSLGVYFLLRRFGAGYDEQIAGLLHDVNHTAFSHVIDYVLGDPSVQEFGDSNHKNVIMNSAIPNILEKKNINAELISNPHNFGLLERDIPDICCDRLDYCLRDSQCCGFIDKEQAEKILDSLVVHEGEIVCKDQESAVLLAKLFLKTSKKLWSNHMQSGSFLLLAEAMKLALKTDIIKEQDFYTTDKEMFDRLINSKNQKILELMNGINKKSIKLGTEDDYDIYTKAKARYIDPKFVDSGKIKRASEADNELKEEIQKFKEDTKKGFYIKIAK